MHCCLPCISAIRRSSPCRLTTSLGFHRLVTYNFDDLDGFITGTLSFIIDEYATMSFRKCYRVAYFEIPMSFWASDSWTMWFPLKKISPSPLGSGYALRRCGLSWHLDKWFSRFHFHRGIRNFYWKSNGTALHCLLLLNKSKIFWREIERIIFTSWYFLANMYRLKREGLIFSWRLDFLQLVTQLGEERFSSHSRLIVEASKIISSFRPE